MFWTDLDMYDYSFCDKFTCKRHDCRRHQVNMPSDRPVSVMAFCKNGLYEKCDNFWSKNE